MWQYRWTRLFGNAIQGSCLSASAFSRGQATGARMPVSASVLRRVLLIVLVTCLVACGKTEPPPSPPPTPAVAANPNVDVELVEALRVFEGRFDWRSDLGWYVFNEMENLRKLVESRNPNFESHDPDPVWNTLVGCIDDFRPARAMLDGKKPVVVGVVCYQALRLFVTHEETDATGDIAQTWAGHIEPTATPSELAAAKKAWLHVLKDKTYGFL